MKTRQSEILQRFDKLLKPLENKVKELDEFCSDGKKVVAPLALQQYRTELNEWKELGLMIMEEFLGIGEQEEA